MGKRIKLEKYSAGTAIKEFYSTILSGEAVIESDLFVAGLSGNLITSVAVSGDSYLYSSQYFDKEYSVNHQDLYSFGYDTQIKATNSKIIDLVQFSDSSFILTQPTVKGTSHTLNTTDNTKTIYQPHTVVTYIPGDTESNIDLYINRMDFTLDSDESSRAVYGEISGSSLVLFVKDNSVSGNINTITCYSAIDEQIPANYLMEQSMNHSLHFRQSEPIYGVLSGDIAIAYVPDCSLQGLTFYNEYELSGNTDKMYVNPFSLKNFYNYNFNTEINRNNQSLIGVRDYIGVGKTQGLIWLKYKYYREDSDFTQQYELVERVRGLYKFKPLEGHKSNIYSIRITNSGLNLGMEDGDIKTSIRNIVEQTINNVVKKIAPANTALFKVEWQGL